MCDTQRKFMIAQANAVAEYIKTQRKAGCILDDNTLVRNWIIQYGPEYRKQWFAENTAST